MANSKISVDVFWKLTNSFTYILPYTDYFKKKTSKIYLKEFVTLMKNMI